MITIGDDGTVGVAVSVRNNLKTRTSLGPVSILRGEEHLDIVIKDIFFCFYFNKNEFYLLLITYYLLLITYLLFLRCGWFLNEINAKKIKYSNS
ncbi:hypothetical protein BvCmsKKP038_04665 [Escherichia coli]|nr:hypothetical protein BvCmsKKP038_04665 [Escherichia coli]